ncbi:MAG: PAS domain S-box protein [Myxococcales bacterium]
MSGERSHDDLLRDERRFRALIEHGRDLLILVDADGTILYCSPSSQRMLGFAPEQLVGTPAVNLAVEEERPRAERILGRIVSSPGARVEESIRMMTRQGGSRTIEGTAVNLLDDPAVRAIVITVHDVTRARQQTVDLEHAEGQLRALADRALDIISRYRVLPEPKLEYVSPSVERITGYTVEEFLENPLMHLQLVHPDDRDELMRLSQRPADELSRPFTIRWVHKDGRTIWMEQRHVPELDEQGRMVAVESIARDVTEHVRLENELRRAQKLEAVGRLAGGIAHDFNNLLGVTLLCAERMKAAVEGDAKLTHWVDMILESAHRGADLTQQLLAFARREVSQTATCDLNFVVTRLLPMLERLLPEDVSLRVDTSATEATVALDQSQLEQVLVNLAVNARDAMPRGGLLTIRSHNVHGTRGDGDGPQPEVVLTVSDTGVGLSPSAVERIFEPFYTTKEESHGTGLGLSVVYGIVKRSGGEIDVDSLPGEGTTFELRWPLAEPLEHQPPPKSTPAPGGQETLLLVEDDGLLRRLECEMLERLGYTVLEAATAAEAEQLFERQDGQVALLLTDVVLTDDSGASLAERLQAKNPELKVVYATGHTDDEVSRHGLPAGQLMLVTKPFSEDELALVVRAALDG